MGKILILDTSILLNVLDVPGFNQDRETVLQEFEDYINEKAIFLVPLGVILETGNHIAQLANGNRRRKFAKKFQVETRKALEGELPWTPVPLPDTNQLGSWLDEFPGSAKGGVGLVDLSIIKAWEVACRKHPLSRVCIWSLDKHLQGYDQVPDSNSKPG